MIYPLLLVVMHVFGMAIDLVSFFIIVRFLRQWRETRLLVALDGLGTPVLTEVTRGVEQARLYFGVRLRLSPNKKLLVALGILTMMRLLAIPLGIIIL